MASFRWNTAASLIKTKIKRRKVEGENDLDNSNFNNDPAIKPEEKKSPHTLLLIILILLVVGIAGAASAKYYLNIKDKGNNTPAPIVEVR